MYIVMEILGKNLNDIRRYLPLKRFTIASTCRAGQQCIEALKNLHKIGYIHR